MIQAMPELIRAALAGTLVEHRHHNVELKSDWREDHGRKVSARTNDATEHPAWLVVGIADDGAPVGKDEKWACDLERVMSQQFNQYLDPIYACRGIEIVRLATAFVIVAHFVHPGTVVRWRGKAYKSVGTTTDEMTQAEILGLTLKLPGATDYSRQPWRGALDDDAARRFVGCVVERRPTDPLAKSQPATAEDLTARLEIREVMASRILFGNVPFRVAFTDRSGNVSRNETYRPGYALLRPEVRADLQRWSREQQGLDRDPYPDEALREALANALAHAAYQERDGELIVECFSDRVEISNLCFPAAGGLANRWFSRAHHSFNPLLMETLRLSNDVDELGRGKSRIMRASLRHGCRVPVVDLESASLYTRWRLKLFARTMDDTHTRLIDRLSSMYHDDQKALVAYALILWRDLPLEQIAQFVDHEWKPYFLSIIYDSRGPVYFDSTSKSIRLSRWVSILLGEGKDSKKLNEQELDRLFDAGIRAQSERSDGCLAPREMRALAGMADSNSEKNLVSQILTHWVTQGRAERLGRGRYRLGQQLAGYSTVKVDIGQFFETNWSSGLNFVNPMKIGSTARVSAFETFESMLGKQIEGYRFPVGYRPPEKEESRVLGPDGRPIK